MLHLIYIVVFSILALLAVSNLIRSLFAVSFNSQSYTPDRRQQVSHPELLDDAGQPVNEPLLVIRSLSVEDARQQLDSIYHNSPGGESEEETND